MWVRGLKPKTLKWADCDNLSHPMWVRGLKQGERLHYPSRDQSHPMWVRGLKPLALDAAILSALVAPHVGAWIETVRRMMR